jgi:hypothetical protein
VLEHNPQALSKASFSTIRRKFISWTKKTPKTGTAQRWHMRTGYPELSALKHLVNASKGVKIKGPIIIQYKACALAKIRKQIRQAPRKFDESSGKRIAVNFHNYASGINEYTFQVILTNRATGYVWDYYFVTRKSADLIKMFGAFFNIMKVYNFIKVKIVEYNNKIEKHSQVAEFLAFKSIRIEPLAPNTQGQNGGAERSGGVLKDKKRAMRVGARFPHALWPEIVKTAVYLYNRTPNYGDSDTRWKSLYTCFRRAVSLARNMPNTKKTKKWLN